MEDINEHDEKHEIVILNENDEEIATVPLEQEEFKKVELLAQSNGMTIDEAVISIFNDFIDELLEKDKEED